MRRAILLAIAMLILLVNSTAQMPTPHGVAGKVYNAVGAKQVITGTNFLVNDTNTSDFVRGKTGPQGGPGRYNVAIDGTDGDLIIVYAWNQTQWGNKTFSLLGDMDNMDVWLNNTRPSEMNVTIIYPQNNTLFNVSRIFNLTANISNIGGIAGTSCNANLTLSDNGSIFGPVSSILVALGTISYNSWAIVNFSLLTNLTGAANATVRAWCSSDGINFEHVDSHTVFNLSSQDIELPNVTLISPLNNTLNVTHSIQTFFYNVSDGSSISLCSLILNDIMAANNTSIIKNTLLNFTLRLASQTYNWSVNCTDTAGNKGTTSFRNLTINVQSINFANVAATNPIFLTAASTSTAWCNATVNNTVSFNATLFHETVFSYSPENNNSHYTNTTCSNNAGNYSCSFEIQYHANNGSWNCNLTSVNYDGDFNHSNASTNIQPLTAIDILPNVIDYGDLSAGQVSTLIPVNISNVGNVLLDLELFAYGSVPDDNVSLNCGVGNLTLESQKVTTNGSDSFDTMSNVSGVSNQPTRLNLSLQKRITDNSYNTTYWRLTAPVGPKTNCSGYVVFTAILK
ncbi:MAG: hypothetical protein AABX51_03705 [Nanoarchaeota archaeon]